MESKLRSKRIEANLTRPELSQLSGVNVKNIELYEYHPERMLRASVCNIIKIANVLNCTVEDIIDISLL